MNAVSPDPIEIDPRDCAWCGLMIDRHVMVDHGDGPEFYCPDLAPDEMTLDELERRAELRLQEEIAAILACMPDAPSIVPADSEPAPYAPAGSTVSAFHYLVALGNAERLKAWLADRPKDTPLLLALLENPS